MVHRKWISFLLNAGFPSTEDAFGNLFQWFLPRLIGYVFAIVVSVGLFVLGAGFYFIAFNPAAFRGDLTPSLNSSQRPNAKAAALDERLPTNQKRAGSRSQSQVANGPVAERRGERIGGQYIHVVRAGELVTVKIQFANRDYWPVRLVADTEDTILYRFDQKWPLSGLSGISSCNMALDCDTVDKKEKRATTIEPRTSFDVVLVARGNNLPTVGSTVNLKVWIQSRRLYRSEPEVLEYFKSEFAKPGADRDLLSHLLSDELARQDDIEGWNSTMYYESSLPVEGSN